MPIKNIPELERILVLLHSSSLCATPEIGHFTIPKLRHIELADTLSYAAQPRALSLSTVFDSLVSFVSLVYLYFFRIGHFIIPKLRHIELADTLICCTAARSAAFTLSRFFGFL